MIFSTRSVNSYGVFKKGKFRDEVEGGKLF